MQDPIKIVIVDDHPIVIQGISMLLANSPNYEIIATFTEGLDLLKYPFIEIVDIVLLDVFLPDINGIDLCKTIKKEHPKIVVLGMSSQSERSLVMQFIQNGANGYLLKNAPLEEFYDCIQKALNGEIVFSQEVKAIISKPEISDFNRLPSLTRREKEILTLLSQGKTTQEMADLLFLSFLTVQTHRRNILNKLEVKNAAELINLAAKNRLI
ncbi:response regulator transcription factor [Flavobacterium sp.]|uniref:response regulator transcription factor n=1 Tax=Flavobacterium sp. TaxID=239 RepID=UPI00286A1AC7|nr:response regulator transcription factor [Flavobacterium sp.]